MISSTDSSGRCSSVTSASGSDARDVEQEPAGHDDLAVAGDVGLERRAQRELHVGRGELEVAVRGLEPDAAEHEHGRPGRERAGDERETRSAKASRGTRCFQHIRDHGF